MGYSYPCLAVESSPALAQSPTRVVSLLLTLERLLETRETGALLVGSKHSRQAIILVEAGRVCWAVAPRMKHRLTTLLRSFGNLPGDRDALERLYRECRSRGRPVGEELVARGLVSTKQLRRALLQHTIEALAIAAEGAFDPEWVPHSQQRYDASFTFTVVDLWATYGALRLPEQARRASVSLRASLLNGGRGFAFVDDGTPVVVASSGCAGGMEALLAGASWAVQTLGLVQQALGVRFLSSRDTAASEPGVATWLEGPLQYYVRYDDPATLAFLFGRHSRLPPEDPVQAIESKDARAS